MNTETGYLLSYLKYGDNDAILHCFTKENAYQSFFLKGIYTQKNKKKAFLSPLNEIVITTFSSRNKSSLLQAKSIDLSKDLKCAHEIKAVSIVFFVSDFLNQVLQKENLPLNFYDEITVFLNELNAKNYQAHFIFLVLVLKALGLAPLSSEGKFLNPETGNFEREESHHLFGKENSEVWKQLIVTSEPYLVKIGTTEKKSFLDSVLVYYQHHFSGFRIPVSLDVVKEIFQ